jgi:hypothetical protein
MWLEEYGYQRKHKNPLIHPLERIYYEYFLLPVKRISAMLKNTKGHKDALIKMKIYFSLRMSGNFRTEYDGSGKL